MQIEENIEWERLEISSRKLEIPREHFMQRCAQLRTEIMDLTEAEDIKKRWKEYTEELYRRDLNDLDNHNDHSPRARHFGRQSQVGLRS